MGVRWIGNGTTMVRSRRNNNVITQNFTIETECVFWVFRHETQKPTGTIKKRSHFQEKVVLCSLHLRSACFIYACACVCICKTNRIWNCTNVLFTFPNKEMNGFVCVGSPVSCICSPVRYKEWIYTCTFYLLSNKSSNDAGLCTADT